MLKKILIALSITLFAGGYAVLAADDAVSLQGIKKVTVNIGRHTDAKTGAAQIDKLTGMEGQRFVYLDLSINMSSGADGIKPYSVLVAGKPQKASPGGCDIGTLMMGEGVSYELGPVKNYNHLLMSIYTGDRVSFPYFDVSCEYTGDTSENRFHIRGFFHVIANSIPTAVSLQLRPFNPPFDVARRVLSRK